MDVLYAIHLCEFSNSTIQYEWKCIPKMSTAININIYIWKNYDSCNKDSSKKPSHLIKTRFNVSVCHLIDIILSQKKWDRDIDDTMWWNMKTFAILCTSYLTSFKQMIPSRNYRHYHGNYNDAILVSCCYRKGYQEVNRRHQPYRVSTGSIWDDVILDVTKILLFLYEKTWHWHGI